MRVRAILSAVTIGVVASTATAAKPTLAISEIAATKAVLAQARAQGQLNVLEQILQGADSQLANTISKTKRFDIVARSKWKSIMDEQEFTDSGDVNPGDPQAARAFQAAGAKYVATVTADNYQDVTQRMVVEGGFGASAAERRTIQLQATLQIWDSTTATMLASAGITLEDSDTSEVMAGARQDGRSTNALIGRMTKDFATKAANIIMDALVPAKVIGYTMGTVTFTRGQGTGVEVDQIWELFHPGEEMIDPDTGESLGSEEIHIGWARVTSVLPKFSKAKAIEDNGVNKGNIMRHAPGGLPAGIAPSAAATGSAYPAAAPTHPVAPPAYQPAPPPATPQYTGPAAAPTGQPQQAAKLVKLALFVRDVSPEVPDEKVSVLESYITAWLTDNNIAVISRAEVLNAVSSFAAAGANAGTGDPMNTMTDRLLSDQSSAVALARNLGADGLLVATITSLIEDRRQVRHPERGNYDNIFYTLDIQWNVVDGGTGASIASGLAQAQDGIRQTATLTRTFNVDNLLRQDAQKIGQAVRTAMASPTTRRPTAVAEATGVQVRIALSDLSVPEIIERDGEFIIGANRYQMEPMACNLIVDGMLAGTVPGVVPITPGPHKIRIERPMIEPVEKFMVVRPGMTLTIPVALSVEGRRQWMEQTQFFESLKDGAVLRKAELEKAKGMAKFLENSQLNIDTSSLQNLGVGVPTVWGQLLGGE
jgi:curli biogenesis system outer membrane secretion channel CsgG